MKTKKVFDDNRGMREYVVEGTGIYIYVRPYQKRDRLNGSKRISVWSAWDRTTNRELASGRGGLKKAVAALEKLQAA